MNRRSLLKSGLFALAAPQVALPPWIDSSAAQGASPMWRHGVSKFGGLKYLADFKQFDYVNAKAPKGGEATAIALGTFDNFNPAVAGVKGTLVFGIDLIYNTLLVSSLDEVASVYGLLAEAVSYPDDFSSATYRLRAEAKWNDGKPVTPDDVVFSFNSFKKLSPMSAASFRAVTKAEKTGDRDVTFTFQGTGNRELPQIVGQLTIVPKHWWEGTDKDGKKRSIAETTLEPPLGSGPYRIKEFAPGHHVIYERVKDYWGKNLNVNLGRDNFDQLALRIFPRRDRRHRGFQGKPCRLADRKQRQELGYRLRFPGGHRKARHTRGIPDQKYRAHAGVHLQYPPRQVQGPARAASLQLRVRFRRDEQEDLLRPVQSHLELFPGHGSRVERPADGPRARIAGERAQRGSRRTLYQALHQPDQRHTRPGTPQSARGHKAVPRSRLRSPRPAAGQRQDRRAILGRVPFQFADV